MACGRPTDAQLEAIETHVSGKHVHDFGAGSCELSVMLLACGAKRVTAIEQWQRLQPVVLESIQDLDCCWTTFEMYAQQQEPIDVAFVSWPLNRADWDLLALVMRARMVVYLGSNTDANQCGGAELWQHFLMRELVAHVPARQNTLLVLGQALEKNRVPTGEERAAALAWRGGRIVRFEETVDTGQM